MHYEHENYRSPAEPDEQPPILVAPEQLQIETLRQLAIEFLLRETGNDISESGVTEERINKVLNALKRKSHFITFDPKTETAGIIEAKELRAHQAVRD